MSLALYLAAVMAALVIGPGGPTYWDSFGYVSQAISGDIGGLGFGKPVFVLVSHAVARAFLAAGGSVWHVEPVLRVFWLAISCAAAPLTFRLAAACGLSRRAAALAGAAVACSPVMAHTSDAVLTDGPAVTLCVLAWLFGARAAGFGGREDATDRPASGRHALGAGIALGLAFGVREPALFFAVSLALLVVAAPRLDRAPIATRMALGLVVAAAAPMAVAVFTQPGYFETIRGWLAGLEHDRGLKRYQLRDVALFFGWVLALGPVAAIAAAGSLARRRGDWFRVGTVAFAVVIPSLVQLALLFTYQGLAYSPRYLLGSLPGALAIPGAVALDAWVGPSRARWALVIAALVAPVVLAAPLIHAREAPLVATIRTLPSMLMSLPPRSVIVTGQPCPAIALVKQQLEFDRSMTRSPDHPIDIQTVCPGWSWPGGPRAPGGLSARLDRALAEGRFVVIDLRSTSWIGAEQKASLAEVQAYWRAHGEAVARGQVIVWQ